MTASHGGVLYYVVKVPKDDPTLDYVSATASHKYLEEKRTLSPLNLEWEFVLKIIHDFGNETTVLIHIG